MCGVYEYVKENYDDSNSEESNWFSIVSLLQNYHHVINQHDEDFQEIYNFAVGSDSNKCNINLGTWSTKNYRGKSGSNKQVIAQ